MVQHVVMHGYYNIGSRLASLQISPGPAMCTVLTSCMLYSVQSINFLVCGACVLGTVMFLHWLAGMIFIFYLASFVMLLREVLRPGVLWFLRNLNDQNFHPINEVIT